MIIHKNNNGGRLGNQLFQIAAAYGHAHKMNSNVFVGDYIKPCFPKWEYNKYLENPIIDNLNMTFDCKFEGIMHEDHYGLQMHYEPIPLKKYLILHGFYQSEKYFEHCKDLIAKQFTPDPNWLEHFNQGNNNWLCKENTVAVHIRRGDYLTSEDRHPVIPLDYYKKSLEQLRDSINKELNIIFFSDDMKWVMNNFFDGKLSSKIGKINRGFSLVNADIVDLYLMAQCKHHIIANSSFSWWGAWLRRIFNDNTGYTFAPATWVGPALSHVNTNDIYLPEWIKVDCS